MTAATAAIPQAGDQETAVAARLCWHAVQTCRALDRGLAELQVALVEAAEHTDAVIELALALASIELSPTDGGLAGSPDARRPAPTAAYQQGVLA